MNIYVVSNFFIMIINDRDISSIVRSCIRKVLNESLSRSVYHFTSIFSALNILETNEMFCQSGKVGNGADNMSGKYDFYISLTRTRSSHEGFGYASSRMGAVARIEFDGDKLNRNFHGEAVNYWGSGDLNNKFTYMRHAQNNKHFEYREITDKDVIGRNRFEKLPPFNYLYNASEDAPDYVEKNGRYYKKVQSIPSDIQHHPDNEIEDRLFTNKPIIENVLKYINRIDILINEEKDKSEETLVALSQLSINYSSIVHMYDNVMDFDRQTDNTVNKQYQDFGKYGMLSPRSHRRENIDFLNDICVLSTFFDSNDVAKKKKALLLKKYGFEKYIRIILKKRDNLYGINVLFNSLMCDSQNVSKNPTREGQIMLKMLNDFLRKNGFSSLEDAYKGMSDKLKKRNSRSSYDWDSIDIQTPMTLRYIKLKDGYAKYIINRESDTDFWFIFGMNSKNDRYYFIEELVNSLDRGYYGDKYKSAIRGNLVTFSKYLKNLAHKKVTLSEMSDIFMKIGIDFNDYMSDFGYPFNIESVDLSYFDASYKGFYAPFRCDDDENDKYIMSFFRKK